MWYQNLLVSEGWCYSVLSVAAIDTTDKSNLKKKGFIWIPFSIIICL